MEAKKLHSRLRAARLAQGLTLRDVSDLTNGGISNPHLSELERGIETSPSPHKLRSVAKALKLDYLELMILAGYLTVKDLKGRV